ncbi:MAG: glycosyltransferase, partial [Cyclobacteriaceae bacterium]
MSKIINLITPSEGHFNPFVPIIKELIERKHNVVCLTGRAYKKRVEDAGAIFKPIPEKWDPMDVEIYDFFPELKIKKGISQIKYYLKNVLFKPIPDILTALENVIKKFPADLILFDTFAYSGLFMTELGGPKCALLSVLPLSLPGRGIAPFGLGFLPGKSIFSKLRNNLLNVIFEKIVFRDVQSYVNVIRAEVGLPAHKKSLFIEGFEKPNLVLHTSIPSFEYDRAEFPENFKFIG